MANKRVNFYVRGRRQEGYGLRILAGPESAPLFVCRTQL